MSKPSLPRCVIQTKHSGQCGRRVADGSLPPVCSVHKAHAQGAQGLLTQPVEANPEDIYQRLMRDSDPAIRLRAVDAWLAYQDKKKSGCDTCRARAESEKVDAAFLPALTHAERDRMGDLLAPWRAFKDEMYAKYPHLQPADYIFRPAVAKTSYVARSLTVAPTLAAPAKRRIEVDRAIPEPEPVVTVTPTPQLSREHWDSVGIFELRDPISGKTFGCTHALGDEHAQKILSGEIPLEQAQREHAASQADGENFVSASLHKILTGAQS